MLDRRAIVSALFIALSWLNTDATIAKGPKGKKRSIGNVAKQVGKGIGRGYDHPHFFYDDLLLGTNALPWIYSHDSYVPVIMDAPVEDGVFPNSSLGAVTPQRFRQPATNVAPYENETQRAFRAGQYESAVRLAKHAIIETPRRGRLYELLSQALFAVGDYRGAASALDQAISHTPQEDWGFVVRNHSQYYRGRDYAEQLRRLSRFIEEYPASADAWLVRGYHNVFLGYQDAARRDLAQASRLESRHDLADRLLARFDTPADERQIEQLPLPPAPQTRDGR